MKKEVMANMDLTSFPIIGLLCFVAVFIGVLIWVYRKNSTPGYLEIAKGALSDGELVKKGESNER